MSSSRNQKPTRFCGTCQHYCWTLGPARKTTCNNLGSIDTTPSCTDYSINPFVLQDFEKVLKPLADVLRVMPITTVTMFQEIISQERGLRRKGFYFMEKVAIKYWGTPSEKFVSNYILAHVFSATNEGVFVIAKSGIRMFILRESVIKLEEFLSLRRGLKESGKITDPSFGNRTSTKQKLAITETLDDIIARGLIEDSELDTGIKRRLNPKRISRELGEKHRSEGEFSTKKRPKIELDEADLFILAAEKSRSCDSMMPQAVDEAMQPFNKIKKKKKKKTAVVTAAPTKDFAALKDKMKKKGGVAVRGVSK
jgi:hypothetical protein